jgi:ABC-2 type transport system permease protein
MRGLLNHLLLTLRLNLRNPQALVFGYLVPVFFLIAFGSVFGSTGDAMLRSLGKVLTIAMLGSACFGLPIGIVSECERGVWRRYRVTPIGAWRILASTVVARLLIMLSSGALVVVVAGLGYGMPWPERPLSLLLAYTAGSLAFIGLGLAIATLASSVAAVQAMGQCLFLPMLMIGGIAIPLRMLPDWAQHASRFMPGRYAVSVLDHSLLANRSLGDAWFALIALVVIGGCGTWAALRMPRWDEQPLGNRAVATTLILVLSAWLATGLAAEIWRLG